MNFLNIKTAVQNRIARTDSTTTGMIGDWINETKERIESMSNWWFLENNTTYNYIGGNVSETNLPTRCKAIKKIYYIYGNEIIDVLQVKDIGNAIQLKNVKTGTISPVMEYVYYIEEQKIKIYPQPESSITFYIIYYSYLPRLVNDNDTNKITDDFPAILINGALNLGFKYLQELDVASEYDRMFKENLQELFARDKAIKSGEPNYELIRTVAESSGQPQS